MKFTSFKMDRGLISVRRGSPGNTPIVVFALLTFWAMPVRAIHHREAHADFVKIQAFPPNRPDQPFTECVGLLLISAQVTRATTVARERKKLTDAFLPQEFENPLFERVWSTSPPRACLRG